jgi:hypothetical protein
MTGITSAGAKLSITASLPATETDSGYGALSYTEIGEVIDIPEYGKTYNPVTYIPLADRKVRKLKGSYNTGSVTVALARDPDDAGQLLAQAALDSDNNYSFELEYSDGSVQYFQAKVMSYTSGAPGADTIVPASILLEIDTDIIEA